MFSHVDLKKKKKAKPIETGKKKSYKRFGGGGRGDVGRSTENFD
jgi:hypothetical protein